VSQQVNLFNPIFLKQKKIFTALHMVQTLGLVAAGALLLAAYGALKTAELERHAASGKAAAAAAEARLAQVALEFPARQKNKDLDADVARLQQELSALRDVRAVIERGELGNTAGYSEYWRAFARQGVSGIWLTGVTLLGPGKEIGLEGRALQPELVPGYIQRLTREAVLQGKTFGSLEITRPGAVPVAADVPAAVRYVEFRLATQPKQVREAGK
jgi:hypothetical protein